MRGCKRARGQPALSGFLVDGRLREAAQQSVGFFFFLQCFIEQADRVFQPELAGPGFQGAVAFATSSDVFIAEVPNDLIRGVYGMAHGAMSLLRHCRNTRGLPRRHDNAERRSSMARALQ